MSPDNIEALLTGILSSLSLVGSLLVILSYYVATQKSNPKVASKLIRNLAISDAVWFLATLLLAGVWIFNATGDDPGTVPDILCMICNPLVGYGRMTSLFWTCCISFNLLQSIERHAKAAVEPQEQRGVIKSIKSDDADHEEAPSSSCCPAGSYKYYFFVNLLSLPGPMYTLVEHRGDGCEAAYEDLGSWYTVTFVELLPIGIGFFFNIVMFVKIRSKMSSSSYPLSVKNRRRSIMYMYIVVCILCWSPTLLFYIIALAGYSVVELEMAARCALYMTGLLNFLVYGMQDRYLKASFRYILISCGCPFLVKRFAQPIKRSYQEKTVMFDASVEDVTKEKNSIFKYHRLSKEEKSSLYARRPDLNADCDITEQLLLDVADNNTQETKSADSSESSCEHLSHYDDEDDEDDDDDDDVTASSGLRSIWGSFDSRLSGSVRKGPLGLAEDGSTASDPHQVIDASVEGSEEVEPSRRCVVS